MRKYDLLSSSLHRNAGNRRAGKPGQDGFTVVETLVSLVVGVILVVAINAVFVTVIRSTSAARNRSVAANTAYSYLRKYAYSNADTSWFSCSADSDYQQNANAQGQPVNSGTLDTSQTDLPQPVAYTIRALAPYGCGGTNQNSPLLIRATITYGPDKVAVEQATYTGSCGTGSSCAVDRLTADLIAWWPFDGDTLDYSGNNNDATNYGATPAIGQDNGANSAYSFDGTSDYMTSGKSLLNGLGAYSFGGWMKYSSGQASNAGFAGQNDSVENYFVNGTDSTFYQGGASTTCTYLATGQWHFIYITWDGTTSRQYADGTLCNTSNNPTRSDSTYNFNIGGGGIRDPSGNYFKGTIDDVRIYERALSASDIQDLYSQGAQ